MPKTKATFIDPMLLPGENLPQGADWSCEIKLDGYVSWPSRAAAKCNCDRATITTSRNATPPLPLRCARCRMKPCWREKWLALDEDGRPSFNLLQNYGSADALLSTFTLARDVGTATEEDVTLSEPDCIVSLDLCCLRKSARERYFDLLRNE